MERISRITDIRTMHLVWAAMTALVLGSALDALTGPLWVHFSIHATALEYVGGGFAVLGYGLLWLLLPISAFRPERRFYTSGDCTLRAKRFGFVFGLLVLVHVWVVVALVLMWGGGWR